MTPGRLFLWLVIILSAVVSSGMAMLVTHISLPAACLVMVAVFGLVAGVAGIVVQRADLLRIRCGCLGVAFGILVSGLVMRSAETYHDAQGPLLALIFVPMGMLAGAMVGLLLPLAKRQRPEPEEQA